MCFSNSCSSFTKRNACSCRLVLLSAISTQHPSRGFTSSPELKLAKDLFSGIDPQCNTPKTARSHQHTQHSYSLQNPSKYSLVKKRYNSRPHWIIVSDDLAAHTTPHHGRKQAYKSDHNSISLTFIPTNLSYQETLLLQHVGPQRRPTVQKERQHENKRDQRKWSSIKKKGSLE